MIIRRYTKADIPDLVMYLEEGLKLFHYRSIDFDADKVSDQLHGNVNNPGHFCDIIVADNGDIGGALCGSVVEFMFSREVYAEHHITYIREGHRSIKAITGLVSNFVDWGKSRGVRQVRWGQSTGFKMEKFAILAKRCGFTQIGTSWSMEIKG